MTAKFKFREIVQVKTRPPDRQRFNGKKGYILGIGEPVDYYPLYTYTVCFDDGSASFDEGDLITTNKFEPKEENPVSIRVFVNEAGEGYSPDTDGTFHDENSDN